MTFGERVLEFYSSLEFTAPLPRGISVMNPYRDPKIMAYAATFFEKFFPDAGPRVLVFGINPGRFGSGTTGISFTDPVALRDICGIANELSGRREPSGDFIYRFIAEWGGPEKFYRNFFITAASPLGFLKDGLNYNFYDQPDLMRATRQFIVDSVNAQLAFGANRNAAIILGNGKNYKIFSELNAEHGFFTKIYPLEHPRFVMQYKRKELGAYLQKYKEVFSQALLT